MFDIREYVPSLQVIREDSTQWRCQCVICGGSSLTISKDNGAYQCWSNACDTKAIMHHLAPAKQEQKDSFNKAHRPAQETRYFYYPTSDNQPLIRVGRKDEGGGKKRIWQQWWDGKSWKSKGMPDTVKEQIRLYRITDQVNQQAIATGSPLLIVEGEALVDRLLSLNIAATTTIGGAGKWKQYGGAKGNYLADLANLSPTHLVICPDRDGAGIKHGQAIAQDFPEAKWLYANPSHWAWSNPYIGSGYDLGDWLDELESQGMTPEAIQQLLRQSIEPQRVFQEPLPKAVTKEPKGSKLAQAYDAIKTLAGDRIRLNELFQQIEWDGVPISTDGLRLKIALDFNIDVSRGDAIDIVTDIARQNAYHPVRQYLEQVHSIYQPDIEALNHIADRYFGTGNPLFNAFLKRTLIGAVARVFRPGCKMDTTLILQGPQGYNKSSFFKVLAGEDWFDDSLGNISDKDERLKLHRSWFSEWPELECVFRRKDISSVKAFLSCATDNLRVPYGRSVESFPRRSVIVGSTNETQFLNDPTGSRRFWVVPVKQRIDVELLKQERDRIWAAAVELYHRGEQWWLTPLEEAAATNANQDFQIEDAWSGYIETFLAGKTWVTTGQVLEEALGIEPARQDKISQMRMADILRGLGWVSKTREMGNRKVRGWVAPTPVQSPPQPLPKVVGGRSEVVGVAKLSHSNASSSPPQPPQPNSQNFENLQSDWELAVDEKPNQNSPKLEPEVVGVVSDVEISAEQGFVTPTTPTQLHQEVVEVVAFAPGDQVGKKFNLGWAGKIQSIKGDVAEVLWNGEAYPSIIALTELKRREQN